MKKEVKFEVFIDGTQTHTILLNGIEELKKYLMETDDSLSYFNSELAFKFECNKLYSDYMSNLFDEESFVPWPDDPISQEKYYKDLSKNIISYNEYIKNKIDKNKFNNFKNGLYDYSDFYNGNWDCKFIIEEGIDDLQNGKTRYSEDGILINENADLITKIIWQ
jgi:uncharacterized CHY-type Zn-finger protein